MTCSILVGGAWGDEGKGKCITYLCDIMISQKLLLVQELDQMPVTLSNLMEKNMA